MLFKVCLLLCLFFIQSTRCTLPNNIQSLEFDDMTSLWEKFPYLIDKLKEAVNRLRCPKGWKRLGGSCFYFPNITSTSTYVNYTCNYLHSNSSNLIRVRNAVEFLYAAHVLNRNNLTSLMIEIDPNLVKAKKIVEILKKDPGLWNRMKESLQDLRRKYQRLKTKILTRLSSTGLKILTRSKKIKEIPPDHEYFNQYHEYYIDHEESNETDQSSSYEVMTNNSSIINDDEYEYDDLDVSDDIDSFEQIDDIYSICDDIHWNVLNDSSNATVFILTKYNVLGKAMCSLSDADPQMKYYYVCEYVLDFCFANILCGKHGRCRNTWQGFECSCSFLYGGVFCEKISNHGRQILIGIGIIIFLGILSIKLIYRSLWGILENLCKDRCRKLRGRSNRRIKKDDLKNLTTVEKAKYNAEQVQQSRSTQRRQTIAQEIMEFLQSLRQCITLPRTPNPLSNPIKRNLIRSIWVGSLSIAFLSLLFIATTMIYYFSFVYNIFNDDDENISMNDTIRLVNQCAYISDYQSGNMIFAPFACVFILLFSWSVKREHWCKHTCDGRPGIIPPIEPFRTGNRFTTATVFGILAFEVLKIFEELLFSAGQPLVHGVLIELLIKIALVILIGLRYYPVLASLQLRNLVARFFACIYIITNIVYTIVREGSCMGFIPLAGQYTVIEEAKLRRELGTWFIVYGLIKNLPHFFFLSYIGAELCVRFAYDSMYSPIKKGKSIWSAPIVESDESEFAKYYVKKLFRRHDKQAVSYIPSYTNPDDLIDHEHDLEQQQRANQSRIRKLINYIYHSDDDFRFTTMAMCTYTVAVVFLYYLACTFVFLYNTRTIGHVAFLKSYFESTFNVDLGVFSFRTEIIFSALITGMLYATQLFIGMQNYKKHKLQLYKGICVDIPLAGSFEADYIASNSVHYSGFLVGYMAWGFVICFHLVLLIAIGIKVLSLQIRAFEIALTIIVPILVVYLLKLLGMKSAGKFLFIPNAGKHLNSQSRKTYAIFVYFSFFADCFLGAASCIIRLVKASVLNIIFMARLDWSFLGRPLEKFDLGFAAYTSYLHMEVTYTNPVMLAFCYSLYDDIVQTRRNHCYVDECCIAPTELDSDDSQSPKPIQIEKARTNFSSNSSAVRYQRINTNDRLSMDNDVLNESKRASQIEAETSLISAKENQKAASTKRIKQQSTIINEEEQGNTSTIVQPTNSSIPIHEYEDETGDDDHRTNDHITVDMTIPSKSSIEKNNPTIKTKSVSVSTDDDLLQISGYLQSSTSTSHDTITSKTSTEVNHNQNNISKNPYETVSIDKKRPANGTTVYSPPSYGVATNPADIYALRTMSYREAQHKTPPLILHRSHQLSVAHQRNHPNDDSSHYSEITNDSIQSSVSNPSYVKFALTKVPSNPTTGTNVIEEKKDDNDIGKETKEMKEKEQQQEKDSVLRVLAKSIPFQPSSSEPTDPSDELKEELEQKRIMRRKRLRFRWHFLYTLIRNYHLFDLRKGREGRLALLHSQKSTFFLEQQQLTPSPVPLELSDTFAHGAVSEQGFTPTPDGTNVPTPIQRPPAVARLISVAASSINNYPTSPAEQYVANRAQMLYDITNQQLNATNASSVSYAPTTVSPNPQALRIPIANTFSNQSAGFCTLFSDPDRPVSNVQLDLTPSQFRPVIGSNQSSADYPLVDSSVARSPIYYTQISHEQQQQAWRQKQIQKIQRKHRYCYVYGDARQTTSPDSLDTTTILAPQTVSFQTTQQQAPPTEDSVPIIRPPTKSPFPFPVQTIQMHSSSAKVEDSSAKSNNQPSQIPPIPPKRMDRVDENSQETSDEDNPIMITSALVHRKDS